MLKKTWHFLWENESWLSWAACLIIAFLLIKFVFFPFMGLLFSSSLPFVIVESSSMEHNQPFDEWWNLSGEWYEQNNITKDQFETWSLKNGFDKGDIIIVIGKKDYKIGDVIVFKSLQPRPVIHRIVKVKPEGTFDTKGDANSKQLTPENSVGKVDEFGIEKGQIIGKAAGRIPKLGMIKLVLVNIFK